MIPKPKIAPFITIAMFFLITQYTGEATRAKKRKAETLLWAMIPSCCCSRVE